MSSFEEIRQRRLAKRKQLIAQSKEPYPTNMPVFSKLSDVRKDFNKLKKAMLRVAGRIVALREHGKSAFVDIFDGTDRFQIFLKQDEIGEAAFKDFFSFVDVGDFIEAYGLAFLTKKQEKSILAKKWRLLAKSIRPLPEKWHGLQDVEERYRKRYLDLLVNKEVRDRFVLRSKIIEFIRRSLSKENFLEVETPLLHPIPGGAFARPFITHHNALDQDLYLRVAPELYLKRLLIGGMPKIFELGRNFRNEGIDVTHNPEFTSIEVYEAFADASRHISFVEKLFKTLVKEVFKKDAISYRNNSISFKGKFAVISFEDILKKFALITDFKAISRDELHLRARQLGVDVPEELGKGRIADEIFRKVCRPRIIQPTFVIRLPQEISPLAKAFDETSADRYLLVIGGLEIVNGFSELNDPIIQREYFEVQERARDKGDEEVMRMDEDFLEAMEYGMPPAGGWAIGIDRLIMLLTDQKNIREVILFPTLRSKE